MWKLSKQTKEALAAAHKEMRSIAAETENRALTDAERSKFDELEARKESLADEVARREKA